MIKKERMKKKLVLIGFLLFAFYVEHTIGQPTPGDGDLGAASGQPVGGGGADLDQNILFLLLSSILYMGYKFRDKITHWYSAIKS